MKTQVNLGRSPTPLLLAVAALTACGGGGDDPPAAAQAAIAALPALGPPTSLDDNRQIGEFYWPDGSTATGGQGQPAAGLNCGNVPEGYHVHAHLSIFLNGRALALPSSVGILPASGARAACDYPVHTHDLSGKVHLHATAPTSFTLGQFFAIWGQTLSRTNVAGITSLPVVIYVTDNNGAVTRYDGDPAAIQLTSHREITFQIGAPIGQVPNFTWTGP